MGMKLAIKFHGTLMVKSKGLHAAAVTPPPPRSPTVVQALVLTVLDTNQHMSLVSVQLVRLSHAVSYAGSLWGVLCLPRITWCEQRDEGGKDLGLILKGPKARVTRVTEGPFAPSWGHFFSLIHTLNFWSLCLAACMMHDMLNG
eukprot:1160192-Pelagomonas_calceolata.AAC.8